MPTAVLAKELRMLLAVQHAFRHRAVVTAAHAVGAAGEHAAVWLLVGAVGTATDRRNRRAWLRGTRTVLVAHALSIALKRVLRRERPAHADLRLPHGRVGRWGMPSSHAASTTAAAIAFGPLLPAVPAARIATLVPPAMGLSRLVVGAHFPTDVIAGSALGAATALAERPRRLR